jgi:uncharacterized protein
MNMDAAQFAKQYGPVAVVTGASSGIGRAMAERLAGAGLDVVLVARRVDRLRTLAEGLEQRHRVRAQVCETDLSQPDAADRILTATSHLDVGLVISNAGFGLKGEHGSNDPAAMSAVVMVNCNTPMRLAHGFASRLRRRGRGGLVFVSSVEGLLGGPYSATYAASKAFLVNLGEGLWGELSPEGIDVLTVCPGLTDTEAPASQGFDVSKMSNVMSPEEVVTRTLDNLGNGPTYIASEHYQKLFEQLLSMPRRAALMSMAKSMKPPA